MKEIISLQAPPDEDELILYEITQEEKVRVLAMNILWSSLVFLLAMIA